MVILGHLLVFTGFVQVIANVIFICFEDQFVNIAWTENGIYKSLRVNPGYLFLLVLFKIISMGVFWIK